MEDETLTLSPSQALNKLVDALQQRDVLLTREDIAWAFDSQKTRDEVVGFVQKCINDDNLLSLEEKLMLDDIDAKRPWIAPNIDDAAVPRTEEDIARETQDLQDETELLKKHTEHLKKQAEMLQGLQESNAKWATAKRKGFMTRKARYDGERAQLQDSIEELMHEMEPSIQKARVASQHGGGNRNSLSSPAPALSAVTEAFKSDDRVLARLQNYTSDTWMPLEDADRRTLERVELLTAKLAQLTTEHIRTKLDRLYLEESEIIPGHYESDENAEREGETLFQDLEYLHQEIPTVAGMAANEAFCRPTTDNIKHHQTDNLRQTALRCEYIMKVLLHLRDRNEMLSSFNQRENLQRAAIAKIYTTVINAPDEMSLLNPKLSKKGAAGRFGTPSRISGMPSTPPPKSRAEGTAGQEALPEIQLLRKLGAAPPPVMNGKTAATLYGDRNAKLMDQEDTYRKSATDSIEKALDESRRMQFLLEDAVMVDSKWAGEKVRLMDSGIQGSLDKIEQRVRSMGGEIGKLQKSGASPADDARLAEFISTWNVEV